MEDLSTSFGEEERQAPPSQSRSAPLLLTISAGASQNGGLTPPLAPGQPVTPPLVVTSSVTPPPGSTAPPIPSPQPLPLPSKSAPALSIVSATSSNPSNITHGHERPWVSNLPQLSGTTETQSFWDMASRAMGVYDGIMVDKWGDRLGNMAIVAGLLIAAIMGFWPVTADDTLQEVVASLQSLSSPSSSPVEAPQPRQTVTAQTIWEIALQLLLLAVVLSVPARHVIQRYTLHLPAPLPDRVRERQRRYDSLMRLGLPVIVVLLELCVAVASCLLIGGLIAFHTNALRWVATGFICFAVVAGGYFTLFPIAQDKWSLVPYDARDVLQELRASIRWIQRPKTDGEQLSTASFSAHGEKCPHALRFPLKQLRNLKAALWVAQHTTNPSERAACLRSAHAFGPIPLKHFDMFRLDLQGLSVAAVTHLFQKTGMMMLRKQEASFKRERIAHLAAYAAWLPPSTWGQETSYTLSAEALQDLNKCVHDDEGVFTEDDDENGADEYALMAYCVVLRGWVSRTEVPAFAPSRWVRGAISRLEKVLKSTGRAHVFGVCLLLDAFASMRLPGHKGQAQLSHKNQEDLGGMLMLFLRETMNLPPEVLQCCLAVLVGDMTKEESGLVGLPRTHARLWMEDPVHTVLTLGWI